MLHAVWNALAKRARDQLVFLWSSVSLASVVLVPVGLLGLPEGGVPAAAVPYVVATIVIHAGYFVTLGRAYRHGDFSRVYPIARGLGVALVPVAALVVFGERLSPLGTVGVALVVAGVAGLHLAVGSRGAGRPRPRGAGTAWALLTGLLIATYSIVDKAGVRCGCAPALIQSEGASAAPPEAAPGKVARAKARARPAVGPTRGYRRPNASVASSATWRPIASEAVAAGEGALRTWIASGPATMRKSSTSEPSGLTAWARTPAPPRTRSAVVSSGTSRPSARANAARLSERYIS